MNRIFRRCFSGKPRPKEFRGCRLLDYSSPSTHISVPRSQYLLGSRSGYRYQNLSVYQEHAELATIALLLARRSLKLKANGATGPEVPPQWPLLRDRLGLAPDTPFTNIESVVETQYSPPKPHIEKWVECVEAPNLTDALQIINSNPAIPWPAFVVLYTLGRHGTSPVEVYNAVRTYQTLLPQMPVHVRPELTSLVLRLAQEHILDLVPTTIRTFLDAMEPADQREFPAPVLNELLWQIARYGKRWSEVDIPVLSEAQELIIRAAGSDKVDAKGIFAIAYVTHFTKPEIAREFMKEMKGSVHSRTPAKNSREFAYTNGPSVIQLLTSKSPEEALAVVDQVEYHLASMWSCAALYLSRNRMLSNEVALRLWNRAVASKLRLSSLFTELIIGSVTSFRAKQKILSHALAAGMRLKTSFVARMANVRTKSDIEEFKSTFPEFLDEKQVLEQILRAQQFCDPEGIWGTYRKLCTSTGNGKNSDVAESTPSRDVLRVLCRAAWDKSLMWDGMYASQRALAEFKLYVRGAAAPSNDVLRVYPDEPLIYAYVVMVGRSGYRNELIPFLGWLEELGFKPTKRILLALIHYSPQGHALLKLGQNTRPPSSNWPTEEEYEVYSKML